MPVFNVTSSPLSTLTQAQQDNLILMSNTDIRTVLSNLASLSTVQASQTASIALNAAGVTELKAVTVIEKTQVLAKTSFTFAANVWSINIFHELNNKFPITAIFDATGDAQFIQFIGKDLMNGIVELTQSQYDLNTFPLNIILHSKLSTIVASPTGGQWKLNTITNIYYRLLNGIIEASNDGISANSNKSTVSSTSAAMNAVDGIALFVYDAYYYSVPLNALSGSWTNLSVAQYQNYISSPSTIPL